MITKELLDTANEMIKKIDFKGKGYALVASRVNAFRAVCPRGRIDTQIISMENGVVTMKATIFDDDERMLSNGYAQEKEGASYINKTSYVENCETSAIGRALGNLGIGSDENIASAEELANAVLNQNGGRAGRQKEENRAAKSADTITETEFGEIMRLIKQADVNEKKLCASYNVESLMMITRVQYTALKNRLESAIARKEGAA